MAGIKCAAERKAEGEADACGYEKVDSYRYAFMLGSMRVSARELEYALSQIAYGKLSADAARNLAKSTLDDMEVGT